MEKMDSALLQVLQEIETKSFQQILPQVNQLKSLLEKDKYSVDAQNADGDTLLHIVVKSGNLRGHNTIQEGNLNPENMFDIAYLTGRFNPNPFIKNNQGMTPSMLAAHLKLTSAWQFLSSYERSYEVKCQAEILRELYYKGTGCFDYQNLISNILKLRGQYTRE